MRRVFKRCLDVLLSLSTWKLGVLGAVLLGLMAGLYFVAIHQPRQRKSLEYAVSQINQAIVLDKLDMLDPYVDFRSIGRAFATDFLQYRGEQTNARDVQKITEKLQLIVLEGFRLGRLEGEPGASGEEKKAESGEGHKNEAAPPKAEDSSEKKKAPSVLPQNALQQLREHPFTVKANDGSLAILSAPMKHAELGFAFDLKLVARPEATGWKVVELANASELIATYFAARKKQYNDLKQDFLSDNAQRKQLMNSHFYITACKAFLSTPRGNRNDASLIVNMEGFNMGTKKLLSSGVRCYLKSPDGRLLAVLPLNSVRQVDPSGFFQQSWQVELSAEFPETSRLLGEKAVECSAEVSSVSISSGRIIYLRPQKELDDIQATFDPEYEPGP